MMNLINLKERIAISAAYTPEERNFLLDAVNDWIDRAATPVHAPPNYLGRIDAIWMVLSVDDGGEGVVAAPIGGLTLPLVAADKRRLELIVPIARQVAKQFGKITRLVKFTKREDVEIYQP